MLDRNLRTQKDAILNPIADRLLASVHPTTLTLIGFTFGLAAAIAAWQALYILAMMLWSLNRIFDGLDGTVARHYNRQTDLGGYIDILADDSVYALVIVGLAAGLNQIPIYVAALLLLASYRVNAASWIYLSSLLEKRQQGAKTQGEKTSITMPPGLIEGTETIIAYFIFLAFPAYAAWLFGVFALLVFVTVGQRLVWATQNI
jgi:phosphatidylglycerophosphate synthase